MRRTSVKLILKLTKKFYTYSTNSSKAKDKKGSPRKYRLSKRCSSKRGEKHHS